MSLNRGSRSGRKATTTLRQRWNFPYCAATGALLAGIAISTLDAAAVTTQAGGSSGATLTSTYLAIFLTSSAAAVTQAPWIARRLGARATYAAVLSVGALVWGLQGILILCGLPPVAILLSGGVLTGASFGLATVLRPLVTKAYMGGQEMAQALARVSVVTGLSWAAGSLVGGFIMGHINPGWGLIVRTLLAIPIIVYVLRRPPETEPSVGGATEAGGGRIQLLRQNPALRRCVLFACCIAAFAVPMSSLVVPIASHLRTSPLIPGAGILSASISIGNALLSIVVVTRLTRRWDDFQAVTIAGCLLAAVLVAYAVSSLLIGHRIELVVWSAVGLAFGGLRYGGRSLVVGAVTATVDDGAAIDAIATLNFCAALALSLGLFLWGLLIDHWSAEAAILVGAAATLATSLAFLRSSARTEPEPSYR